MQSKKEEVFTWVFLDGLYYHPEKDALAVRGLLSFQMEDYSIRVWDSYWEPESLGWIHIGDYEL